MPQENPNQKPSEPGVAGGTTEGPGTEGGAPGATLSMEEVEKLVDARVNGALTTHFNRFKGVMAKDVEGQVSRGMTPIMEKLAAMETSFKERPATPTPSGDQPLSAAVEAATRKAEARIKELEAKADASERARAESETTRLQQEERSALASALGASGVEGVKQNVLIAYLHKEKGLVRRNDKGEVCLRLTRPYGEDDVLLSEAVPEWLKTAEGKEFMPPRPASGSGAAGGKAQGKGGPGDIKDAAQSTVLRAFGFKQ